MEGPLLLKNLQEAYDMTKLCEDACRDFEKCTPTNLIDEWKTMKRRWEIDLTQPDPYVVVEKGKAVSHTTPSTLTLGSRSLEPQFYKTEACGDRSARIRFRRPVPPRAISLHVRL